MMCKGRLPAGVIGRRWSGLGPAFALLAGLACALSVFLACGEDSAPQAQPAAPSPVASSPVPPQKSTLAPPSPMATPPAPSPTVAPPPPSPTGTPAASDASPRAPGFSLLSGVGSRVTLDELLDEHEAVVLVFYRGFF